MWRAVLDDVFAHAAQLRHHRRERLCPELAIAVRESHRRGIVKVELPLEDRELKIIPSARRYVGRRASEGTEAFIEFIQGYKR